MVQQQGHKEAMHLKMVGYRNGVPMYINVTKRYTNRWYTHCKKVQAQLIAEGKHWSWADILMHASKSYTKKERKPKHTHDITWSDYCKVYASVAGCSYGAAMKAEDCQKSWREFNTEPETVENAEAVPDESAEAERVIESYRINRTGRSQCSRSERKVVALTSDGSFTRNVARVAREASVCLHRKAVKKKYQASVEE